MSVIVDIYRSKKKEGAYLYVRKGYELQDLPTALVQQFGKGEFAMKLLLTPEKKLASADVEKVMASVLEQGFYLQLPPKPETYMQRIPNDKM